jgi:FtsZ-binding cell division protein ZapB
METENTTLQAEVGRAQREASALNESAQHELEAHKVWGMDLEFVPTRGWPVSVLFITDLMLQMELMTLRGEHARLKEQLAVRDGSIVELQHVSL